MRYIWPAGIIRPGRKRAGAFCWTHSRRLEFANSSKTEIHPREGAGDGTEVDHSVAMIRPHTVSGGGVESRHASYGVGGSQEPDERLARCRG